jgi:tRNA (guanosine-2'-O-)-methyltransferase
MDYVLPEHLENHRGSLRALLENIITPERQERFSSVLNGRTRAVVPVFQDTHHTHNISAVLRTADALGFQDALFVYQEEYKKPRLHDTVERGASRWLSLRRANNIEICARTLKASGYAIGLVTLPNFLVSSAHYQHQLPAFASPEFSGEAFTEFLGGRRLALVFGNESEGISKEWAPFADLYCYVPMTGFVESLNLSVCAGMLLGKLKEVIDSSMIPSWSEGLTPNEREYLFDHWCIQTFARTRSLVDNKAPELKEYFRNMAIGAYFAPFVP